MSPKPTFLLSEEIYFVETGQVAAAFIFFFEGSIRQKQVESCSHFNCATYKSTNRNTYYEK